MGQFHNTINKAFKSTYFFRTFLSCCLDKDFPEQLIAHVKNKIGFVNFSAKK